MNILDQLSEKQISLGAKGLYVYLSVIVPEGYAISFAGIKTLCSESKDRLYKLIRELILSGLMEKHIITDQNGRRKSVLYEIKRDDSVAYLFSNVKEAE